MRAIFYDLETTDTHPIGQILNYCFITVDTKWNIVSELSGDVRISRLQLPTAGAILANKTDVLSHQKTSTLSEKEAMREIHDYIEGVIGSSRAKIPLIGYNSSKFDLLHLRTGFIRNGIGPYFKGRLSYKDLLFASWKLACNDPAFPRLPAEGRPDADENRLSLSLENVAKRLGLLVGRQIHSSREDVILTIDLAKVYNDRFGLDVRTYDSYEARNIDQKGALIAAEFPNYDLTETAPSVSYPMVILDNDHRYVLWLNLDKYREGLGKRSIRWINKGAGSLIVKDKSYRDAECKKISKKALKEFERVTLNNFFTKSSCDIEQDIYRLDFDAIDALEKALWQGDRSAVEGLKNRDAKVTFLRNELANYTWGDGQDSRMEKMLREYSLHRYGGRLKMNKWEPDPDNSDDTGDRYHATFLELLGEIDEKMKEISSDGRKLLTSLRKFYLESDIYRVAGSPLTDGSPEHPLTENIAQQA